MSERLETNAPVKLSLRINGSIYGPTQLKQQRLLGGSCLFESLALSFLVFLCHRKKPPKTTTTTAAVFRLARGRRVSLRGVTAQRARRSCSRHWPWRRREDAASPSAMVRPCWETTEQRHVCLNKRGSTRRGFGRRSSFVAAGSANCHDVNRAPFILLEGFNWLHSGEFGGATFLQRLSFYHADWCKR